MTGSQYFGNGYLGGTLSKQAEEDSRSSQSDKKCSISKETGKGFSSGSDVDLISKERELCYYIRDEQGSVRYVVDQSGNVVNEYQYSAFGETERAEERYENRLCYNGQMYDGLTEQYYLRARYYQPKTGRFTQEDFLYEDGLNLYAYCKSNPVMYCDPSGLAGIPVNNPACETKVRAEGGGVAEGENQEYVDLTDFRKEHILNRHKSGIGLPGKTEFPSSWSDEKILHYISDVATDPNATSGYGKWNSPYAIGIREGIEIRVDFYPDTHPKYSGMISTGYPLNTPVNLE